MSRTGRIAVACILALVPILPLPAILLHDPGPGDPPGLRPVRDFDASKWAAAAVGLLALQALATGRLLLSRDRPVLRIPPGTLPLSGLALLALVSAVWAPAQGAALAAAAHLALLGGMFVVSVQLVDERARAPLSGILFATAVVALYGIAQRAGFDFPSVRWQGERRAVATLANPNFASEFLVVTIPFALAAVLRASRVAVAVAAGGVAAAGILHLALTETRAGWIALAAGGTAGLVSIVRAGGTPLRRLLVRTVPLLAVAAALLLVPGLGGDDVIRKAATIADPDHPSTRVRGLLYESTLDMIADRPALGFGAGSFPVEYPRYREAAEVELSGYLSRVSTAHQDYLQIAAELGLIGLALWLAFLARLGRAGVSSRAPTSEPWIRAAALASVAGFAVNGLFRSPLANPAAVVVVAVAAAIVARPFARAWTPSPLLVRLTPLALAIPLAIAVLETRRLEADRLLRRAIGYEELAERANRQARFLEETSRDAEARDALARTVAALEQARAVLERATRVHPSSFESWFRLGRARATLGRTQEARQAYARAVRLRPHDASALVNLAVREAELGELDSARSRLERARELAPLDPVVHFNLGRVRVHEGRFLEAALAFEQAADLRPRHAKTYEELVSCYAMLEEQSGGTSYLPLIERARDRLKLVEALERLDAGQADRALAIVAPRVAGDDVLPEARRLYAALLAGEGRIDDAARELERLGETEEGSWIDHEPAVRELRATRAFEEAARIAGIRS